MKTAEVDPLIALGFCVALRGSQKAAAKALGIKPSYLHDLLHGRRKFSAAVLKRLGLKRVVVRANGAA
jgi:DNA-binding transcriptional regulator YdaS (Cro superfamily)